MTPEGKVKARIKRILDSLRDSGLPLYYFMPAANGYGRAGIPDFIICANGHFISVEAKAAGGKPTALQEREFHRIRAAKGMSLVVYNDDLELIAALSAAFGDYENEQRSDAESP